MNKRNEKIIDQHAIADWPVEIHEINEVPKVYQEAVWKYINDDFSGYIIIFAPACQMIKSSSDYLLAYGKKRIFYFYQEFNKVKLIFIKQEEIHEIMTRKELLDAEIIIKYKKGELVLPYVASSYYLYDPFLNWLVGLDKEFSLILAERENPRPRELYHDSLTMFNYSLAAYRLGKNFKEYNYKFERHRKKWMPWKSTLEEWLDIMMEQGAFHLHSLEYLIECTYKLK